VEGLASIADDERIGPLLDRRRCRHSDLRRSDLEGRLQPAPRDKPKANFIVAESLGPTIGLSNDGDATAILKPAELYVWDNAGFATTVPLTIYSKDDQERSIGPHSNRVMMTGVDRADFDRLSRVFPDGIWSADHMGLNVSCTVHVTFLGVRGRFRNQGE
jgi:hypothetical protein